MIALCLVVTAALGDGPTQKERQTAQNMINNGNTLKARADKARQEAAKAAREWLGDPSPENLDEAIDKYIDMLEANERLKENRDSTIAYVDSVFGIDKPAGTDVQFDPSCTDYGYTSSRCFVRLCGPAFESPDILASTKIHEYEHVKQKKAGRWGPGNVPRACTFDFHSLEFDAYQAEMNADFGGQTTLPIDEKLMILRRKQEHLSGMIEDLAAQFEGEKLKRSRPGEVVDKYLTVANTGSSPQFVSGMIYDQQGWNISPPGFEFLIGAGEDTTFLVQVEVPPTSETGIGNEVLCGLFPADSAAFFFVNVIPSVDVIAGGDVEGSAYDLVDFTFTIVNEDAIPDTFNVEVRSVLGWSLSDDFWTVALNPSESIDLGAQVEIADSAWGTSDLLVCTAWSTTNPMEADSSWLNAAVEVAAAVGERESSFKFALMQNAPNPFAGGTSIRFSLPTSSRVDLRVFDVRGRLVKTLAASGSGAFAPGIHTVQWDGRDDYGRRVASGVYFYKLQAGGRMATRKMVMLR
jgi:hypothetical protein